MFEQLKGIEKEREEKAKTSNLDYLLDVCDELLRKYNRFSTNNEKTNTLHMLLAKAYDRVKTINFSEQDLKDFIFTKANNDFERLEAMAVGKYTGILLQALTERNEKEGKDTRFYINGQGNKFDCLFHATKNIGDLIVENFRGEDICAHFGGDDCDGRINIVAGIGLEGSSALSACSNINDHSIIIGKNIKGNNAIEFAGVGSKIGLVLAQDIEGRDALFATAAKGKANFVFAENIRGDYCMERIGVDEGKIRAIYARNISGEDILLYAGEGEFKEDVEYNAGDIGLILYDMPGKRLHEVNVKRVISHRNKKFPKLVSDYKIRQFFKLITPIDKVSVEGKFAILDQVKALYESIRHKAGK